MPSEARRGLSRVTTNYARLLATMAIGLVVVPLQLAWVGTEGYGLIALLASSIGIGGMLQDTMRHSMVRELGAAWHTDKAAFARVYATSFWISGAIAVISAVFFIALIAALPFIGALFPGLMIRAGAGTVATGSPPRCPAVSRCCGWRIGRVSQNDRLSDAGSLRGFMVVGERRRARPVLYGLLRRSERL